MDDPIGILNEVAALTDYLLKSYRDELVPLDPTAVPGNTIKTAT